MQTYNLIGLMSGTSLDGIDLVYSTYSEQSFQEWTFKLHHSKTYSLHEEFKSQLMNIFHLSALDLMQLNYDLGIAFAESIDQFIIEFDINKSDIHAIASHGQTVFHQPENGFTTQLGNPAVIAHKTGIPVIGDFRTKDVLHGGQGAPLVPIGDNYLFSSRADAFLNIGGFCNVSFKKNKQVLAFDICPGNLPLNFLANKLELPFDNNGCLSKNGTLNPELLHELNRIDFYAQNYPKSLGTEWLNNEFLPKLNMHISVEDILRTVVEHIAIQVSTVLNKNELKTVFITGGGALNDFLIERIQENYLGQIILPERELIDFKEAIIFGLLGALFLTGQTNCLSSVTGATKDVKGGVLYEP